MGNFGQFVQDKESDDAGQLLSASLGKLRKDRSELGFNQGLASQHMLKDNNGFSDKIHRLQYKRKQYKRF